MFGPSKWNAEDIDDYLVLQRDWGVDGGLRTVTEDGLRRGARRAARACRPCTAGSGWPSSTTHVDRGRRGRARRTSRRRPAGGAARRDAIQERQLAILDVVTALYATGFEDEAGRVLEMVHARVAGDYLQTAAIFDEQHERASRVTDPNDYAGPGTGYETPAASAGTRSTRSASSGRATTCGAAARRPPRECRASARRARRGGRGRTRERSASVSRRRSRQLGSRCPDSRSSTPSPSCSPGLEEEGCRPHRAGPTPSTSA